MFDKYTFTVKDRFLKYVQVDTESDPQSESFPSTDKQKNLSKILAEELQAMGVSDAHTDQYGYVYATLPSNIDKNIPTICFCSHVDTTSDCSGKNVKPRVHNNYNGEVISYPDDNSLYLDPKNQSHLSEKIGHDIITASGLTLLGSDDKSGVAIIMDFVNYLLQNPSIKHGTIKILFTPDEEVGRGTEKVDLKKINADFAYTLDGGNVGEYEDETFSADAVEITIFGKSIHPGWAKNKMVNAARITAEIVATLPQDKMCPEATEGKEGFLHLTRSEGVVEKASLQFIIRDFEDEGLVILENYLKNTAEKVLQKYPQAEMKFDVKEQYRNMKKVIQNHPQLNEYAYLAIQQAGLEVKNVPIRGGTDGSKLSYMGLPCPNLFTGMQSIHSRLEWVSVQDMQKAVETLVHLVQIWESKS